MAAKNEAKIRFSAETKDFDAGIKSANGTLTTLRNELKLNEAQMRNNGVSIEGLKEKQKNLTAQMDAAKDKTKALSDKLAVAVDVFGENSNEANKLRNQLINAQTAEVKLQGAIDRCNAELERQEQASKDAESASGKLSDEIGEQQKELKKLKDAYVDAVLEFGEGSDEANELGEQIEELSDELKENKKRMKDATDSADKLDKSLDDLDPDPEGFTVLNGALADLVSEGIQSVISGLGELMSYFGQLPQETMELRQDMGTLVTAFDNVGLSTETATDTWKELYKVFGEDDRAVETANNIARIADNEKDLNDWITITTGIWGTYQDSLPVEGLAEAAAETAKTGTVTGGLADALNWSSEAAVMFADYMSEDVVTAEDAFNEALAECSTEQERQALITDTLTKLYGGAADKYRDTTSAQMEAKEATAEQILAENNLADAIEPVTTAWQGMKNELLVGILPTVEKVSGAMVSALEWMKEHPVAMKVIAAVLGVVAAALAALTVVTIAQTVAQWALNSAILANPLTWIIVAIVAAIAAVVAIIILVIEYWDEIVAAVSSAWESIKNTLSEWGEWISKNVIVPIAEFFTGLWEDITTACSTAWNGIKTFFSDLWESITSTATTAWDGVLSFFAGIPAWFDEKVIQPVVNFFTGLWEALVTIWNTICDVVQFAIMLIGSIISAAVDIITLPFRFIWENCKEYVFAAWEWIKNAVSTAITFVRDIVVAVFTAVANFFSVIWEGIKSVVGAAWDWIIGKVTTVVNNVLNVVTTVWNAIKNVTTTVFEAVKSVVVPAWEFIRNIIFTVVYSIRDAIFAVWDWIVAKVTTAINTVSAIVTSVMGAIRDTISNIWEGIKNVVASAWDAITTNVTAAVNGAKNVVTSVFNGIKSVASNIWNNIKTAVSNAVNGIKITVTSVFNGVKSTVSNVWNGIKNAIMTPIEAAKEKVKGAVDAIKGFFSGMKLELPKIKLPHFKITGKLSISPPSVPKLSIEWYKDGGIMTNPTIFGMNGNSLMAGGEAGPEAILPIDRLQGYISSAIDKTMQTVNINALVAAVEDLANRPVVMNVNGRQFAVATAADTDSVNGNRLALSKRGLAL